MVALPDQDRPDDDTDAAAVEHVRYIVATSGTSFSLGMKILPQDRRHAMFAIYAFCREVDDIADEPGDPEDKLAQLQEWRDEIDRLYAGRPTRPTTLALAAPIRRFGLPREEFFAMIDGMEMDARELMRGPSFADLTLYCRRVAGAVGLLSIRAFGAAEPAAGDFALALGEALQLTNILRDLDEDAARGRLYLPAELLAQHGIPAGGDPQAVLAHPALPAVCTALSAVARRRFAEADTALARCDRRTLRPALLMMGTYVCTLERLDRSGWRPGDRAVHLSKLEKLWAAIRYGLFRPRWRPST